MRESVGHVEQKAPDLPYSDADTTCVPIGEQVLDDLVDLSLEIPKAEDANTQDSENEWLPGEGSFKTYLHEIGRIPLLPDEREKELAIRAHKGDHEASVQLVEANLRLVVSIAKHYVYSRIPLEELVQEGNIALWRAAATYNPHHPKHAKFSTYATWEIRHHLFVVAKEPMAQKRHGAQRNIYLSEWEGDDDNDAGLRELPDTRLSTEAAVLASEQRTLLMEGLNGLSPRQRAAFVWHLGLVDGHEQTFVEIMSQLGVNRARAYQLYAKACRNMAAYLIRKEMS